MSARLGPHRQTGAHDNELRAYIREVRPPVVKCVDEFPRWVADEVHAYGGKVLGRWVFKEHEQGLEPAAWRGTIARIVAKAIEHPWIDAWEFHNEAHDNPQDMARYASACLEFIDAMRRIGKIAVVGSFAHGTPELAVSGKPPEWPAFLPVLREAAADPERVKIALHEYGGGDVRSFVPWNIHRHKLALAEWKSLGLPPTIRIWITESLVDDVPKGSGKFGWRMWGGDVAALFHWYCSTVDQAVEAVMDFGWGGWPGQPEPKASSYDLGADAGVLRRTIDLQKTIPQRQEVLVSQTLASMLSKALGDRFSDDRQRLAARGRPYFAADSKAMPYLCIHHTATDRDTTVDSIDAGHRAAPNRWPGIGYHFVIRRGRLHYVGDVDTQRAHVKGRNHEAIGAAITGNYTQYDPAPEDLAILQTLDAELTAFFGKPKELTTHGEMLPDYTACPGTRLAVLVPGIRGAPVPTGPDYAKVVWATEEAARILKREGLRAEHDYVVEHYVADAVRLRDN